MEECYCGRVDFLENWEPILDEDGKRAMRCPDCSGLDYLLWLPSDVRSLIYEEAEWRHTPSEVLAQMSYLTDIIYFDTEP